MDSRTVFRLRDIVDAIDQIDLLLTGKEISNLMQERATKAAFERFLEIVSEASRHIPPELQAEAPQIPWHLIAGIGNHLRHAYHRVDAEILWRTYRDGDLAALQAPANLPEKYRPAIIDHDEKRNRQKYGKQDDQRACCTENVESSLQAELKPVPAIQRDKAFRLANVGIRCVESHHLHCFCREGRVLELI